MTFTYDKDTVVAPMRGADSLPGHRMHGYTFGPRYLERHERQRTQTHRNGIS